MISEINISRKIVFCILLAGVAVLSNCSGKHPTDEALIENFKAHRKEFDKLLQMFQEDKALGRVAPDFTRPKNAQTIGVTGQRLDAYRDLFDNLEIKSGIEGYDDKTTVWFHSSSSGLSVSGSSKGYAFLRNPPASTTDNLDNYRSPDGKSFIAFRHIEDNWYLYSDYED